GTYEISTQPYKDCCSLTAKRPRTRVNFDRFRRELADFPMERTVSETLAQIDCRDFS
ncbi:MAG TPA: tRNA 4-thiouridine(8) synthase ThiI, partial [Candidatus Moranbacteria bacterium]|nr:tRNA 4-thiouridine(8) synthase ThiI [Candidatus Moranbacteria bacterium]